MSGGAERRAAMRTPANSPSYLSRAEACLAAAAVARDPTARALHEEECKLWLMLARNRTAIDAVLQRHLEPA